MSDQRLELLRERYQAVQQKIAAACGSANRSVDEVTLVVVTKNHPVSLVTDLLELGHRDFGENRDQEAKPKAEFLLENSSIVRSDYRWHFVGQLQSNKVKSVLDYADFIHSLDRESLLSELAKQTQRRQLEDPAFRELGVFIQLNLTEDANRGGIQIADLEKFANQVLQVSSLKLSGVMAVASIDGDLERELDLVRKASEKLRALEPKAKFISAGMSNDFEAAIRHGATHLRIGTAITGNRL